jgi:7,8-dihydropterin-6-yl-methyl-4-(beta-D-ribofuranosyl)aminobenzene 5'-phosphate synthase
MSRFSFRSQRWRRFFPGVFALLIVLGLALLGSPLSAAVRWQSPTGSPLAQSAASSSPRITVLYDAFGKPSSFQKDWGYSALVEFGGKRILFDTGNNGPLFAANAKASRVDLSKVDLVVLSHRHGDHMGGLARLLSVNPKVPIYAPKEGFGVYGADLPSTFYRKDESLPSEQRYYAGRPPKVMRFGSAWPNADFRLIDRNTEIAPGVHLIAKVSDKPGTLELRELSLVLDTPDGAVVVVGCSHAGVDNIVAEAAKINPRIQLVAGGFHLVVANDKEIARVTSALHDTYKVNYIAPGHCTGEPTFKALQAAFGNRDLYAGVGTRLDLSSLGQTATAWSLDHGELATYRQLLRQSDDQRDVA